MLAESDVHLRPSTRSLEQRLGQTKSVEDIPEPMSGCPAPTGRADLGDAEEQSSTPLFSVHRYNGFAPRAAIALAFASVVRGHGEEARQHTTAAQA